MTRRQALARRQERHEHQLELRQRLRRRRDLQLQGHGHLDQREANHNTAAGTTVIGGGGIFNHDGNLWLGSHFTSGTSVDWNVAPAGGGIYQYGTASHLTIDNGDVNHNTATGSGGGINNQARTR